ncbi:MAG TPA: hypothetical protein VFZ81_08255 [Burkholderiales bacterium]|jgi:hypothetical protein
MSNEHDKTLKLVTNLDRGAIEGRLGELRKAAQSSNLAELAALFSGIEGMPRAEMQKRISDALKWLADKPQYNNLRGELEMVELNLPNLQ